MLVAQVSIMILTGYIAIQAFITPEPLQISLFELLGNQINLVVDGLSAFFILVINITIFTGALYANGYLAKYRNNKTKTELAWHFFNFLVLYVSLLMVVMLRDGIGFLVFWELMSVSTFFLIVFDSEKQESKSAGIKFLIQMHIAFFLLVIAFIIASLSTGQKIGFDSLAYYFSDYPVLPLFLLFFAGFGIKAGFIPLHTWLPHAHPAAPSHISGIMSGVLIKMGIYGIVRVLTYIHTELLTVGIFILIISVISGILGVVIAIVQHDFKKLLAYHSIENIGIIGIGIGIGVIGLAINNQVLACLGFAGGLLHVLNHSLFKSLLFYSAGSVYQQTHTRNIDELGGLIKKMPATAVSFLIGAMAISGLPPLNGFISEFLIYSGLFKSLSGDNLLIIFLLLGGIVALVVIGGLAVFCFTKVFSILFLGNPRSEKALHAHEVGKGMLLPQYLISIFIITIGMFSFLALKPLSVITGIFVEDTSVLQSMAGTMSGISLALYVFIGIIGILWFFRVKISKNKTSTNEATWGCAYTGGDPAVHQYTATSYAAYITKKAKLIAGVKKNFSSLEKEDVFPASTHFETHNSDVFEDNLVVKPAKKALAFLERMAVFQTGNIQHYLLYGIVFIIVIAVLTIFKLI